MGAMTQDAAAEWTRRTERKKWLTHLSELPEDQFRNHRDEISSLPKKEIRYIRRERRRKTSGRNQEATGQAQRSTGETYVQEGNNEEVEVEVEESDKHEEDSAEQPGGGTQTGVSAMKAGEALGAFMEGLSFLCRELGSILSTAFIATIVSLMLLYQHPYEVTRLLAKKTILDGFQWCADTLYSQIRSKDPPPRPGPQWGSSCKLQQDMREYMSRLCDLQQPIREMKWILKKLAKSRRELYVNPDQRAWNQTDFDGATETILAILESMARETNSSCVTVRKGAENVICFARNLNVGSEYRGWPTVWSFWVWLFRGTNAEHRDTVKALAHRLERQILRPWASHQNTLNELTATLGCELQIYSEQINQLLLPYSLFYHVYLGFCMTSGCEKERTELQDWRTYPREMWRESIEWSKAVRLVGETTADWHSCMLTAPSQWSGADGKKEEEWQTWVKAFAKMGERVLEALHSERRNVKTNASWKKWFQRFQR